MERCVGRLRRNHIYSDTVKIIKEMLAEEGDARTFWGHLESKRLLSRVLFLSIPWKPENVFLFNEIFDENNQKYGTTNGKTGIIENPNSVKGKNSTQCDTCDGRDN